MGTTTTGHIFELTRLQNRACRVARCRNGSRLDWGLFQEESPYKGDGVRAYGYRRNGSFFIRKTSHAARSRGTCLVQFLYGKSPLPAWRRRVVLPDQSMWQDLGHKLCTDIDVHQRRVVTNVGMAWEGAQWFERRRTMPVCWISDS